MHGLRCWIFLVALGGTASSRQFGIAGAWPGIDLDFFLSRPFASILGLASNLVEVGPRGGRGGGVEGHKVFSKGSEITKSPGSSLETSGTLWRHL